MNDSLPPQLLEPNYQNRLRIIGRQLDTVECYAVSVIEVSGGFVVRSLRTDHRGSTILEFPDSQFPALIEAAIADRGSQRTPRTTSNVLPTGREDFLRAVGYELDQRIAESIVITEFATYIAVCGYEPSLDSPSNAFAPFSDAFGLQHIQSVLDAAYNRRGTYRPVKR